ncbi:hypothetical protein Trisim1_000917 [Trichoderma cf. simile WF8]
MAVPLNGIRFAGWLSVVAMTAPPTSVSSPLFAATFVSSQGSACTGTAELCRPASELMSKISRRGGEFWSHGGSFILRGSLADTLNMDLLISLLLVSNERDSTAPRAATVLRIPSGRVCGTKMAF